MKDQNNPLDHPWLTIVTVVKDDPLGFTATIQSVTHQDLQGVEYLVIDSSTDESEIRQTLDRIGTPARLIWTKPQGIYAAMNVGLEQARGTFVYFANAGDSLNAGVITRVRTQLTAPNNLAWAYGPVTVVSQDGSQRETPPWDFEIEKLNAFSNGNFPSHQGTFARRSALKEIGGFNTRFKVAADYSAFLALSQISAPIELSFSIATFHEGGISTNQWLTAHREFHQARKEILQLDADQSTREKRNYRRRLLAAGLYRSPWPFALALTALTFIFLLGTGAGPTTSLLSTCVVFIQGLSGALWWRMLRPERGSTPVELVGIGIALGTAAALISGLLAAWWIAPAVIGIVWLWRSKYRPPPRDLLPLDRASLSGVAVGLTLGILGLLIAVRDYPLTWLGINSTYHGDMLFFEALSTSMSRFWPESIFMSGTELKYHSLVYAWVGQVTDASFAAPFVTLTRTLPLITLLAVVALAAAWARRLTLTWWAPTLAVALIVTGGFVGAAFGTILNFDSPSQTFSIVWLLGFSITLLNYLRPRQSHWNLLLLALLAIVMAGGKVSTSAVALGALLIMFLIALILRSSWLTRVGLVLLTTGFATFATYAILIAGSANAGGLGIWSLLDRASSVQGLNPVITPRGVIAGIIALLIAISIRWVGTIWFFTTKQARTQPVAIYAGGLAAAGIMSVALLSGGFNDLWFVLAASAPLSVLSADGFAHAISAMGPSRRLNYLWAFLWGLLSAFAVAAAWATGSTGVIGQGWRWAAAPLALVLGILGAIILGARSKTVMVYAMAIFIVMAVISRPLYLVAERFNPAVAQVMPQSLFAFDTRFVQSLNGELVAQWSDSQNTAGAWLRNNALSGDVTATNVTYSALVPALSRQQTWISALHYQAPYGTSDNVEPALIREAESWAFINTPSEDTVAPLCAAGIDWIWVDTGLTQARDWEPWAQIVVRESDVTVLSLNQSRCR